VSDQSVQILSIVVTIVAGMLTVVGSNIALFLWSRSESRSDQQENREIIRAIHEEIRDFHNRLCAIERSKE